MYYFITCIGFFFIVLLPKNCYCADGICNRIPLGITTAALPPDNLYYVDIGNIGDKYLPGSTYLVTLKAKDDEKFIAFTISAIGDERFNPSNPRKPKVLLPGVIKPAHGEDNAKIGAPCNHTVIQNNVNPKSEIKVTWIAPPKGNGCVTISALVAIKQDVYYSDQGPLKRRVCEDERKPDDMKPKINNYCSVCEDAKYKISSFCLPATSSAWNSFIAIAPGTVHFSGIKSSLCPFPGFKLTFEGLWSYNTHPMLYPSSNTSSFSEIVGASHDKNYAIFEVNEEASEGMKMLAEQGNTTNLEIDMQAKIGQSVRTIIKASRPPTTASSATALFRVNSEQHLVSVVTAILPSPDWFLGASNIELCTADDTRWADQVTLNLYPMDAGTDKGNDFNSANDIMMPAQPISTTTFLNTPKEQVKPFARIRFNLIRTFDLTPACLEKKENDQGTNNNDNTDDTRDYGNGEGEDQSEDRYQTKTTSSEAPEVVDPDSSPECQMTPWSEWAPCEGECEGGKRVGRHMRYRYHVVDGVPLKYSEEVSEDTTVSEHCFRTNSVYEDEACEENCEETDTADPASLQQPAPGRSWRFWSK